MDKREAHWVSGWLVVSTVHGWDEVALEPDLFVEFILAVAESGGLFETIPLLRALAIAVGPPLSLRASFGLT